jgi:hypothetical protein
MGGVVVGLVFVLWSVWGVGWIVVVADWVSTILSS